MRIVTVDNDTKRLETLSKLLKSKYPSCRLTEFTDPMLSAKFICNNHVNMVFAQEEMNRVNGEVLKYVIEVNKPEVMVVLFLDVDSNTDLEQLLLVL